MKLLTSSRGLNANGLSRSGKEKPRRREGNAGALSEARRGPRRAWLLAAKQHSKPRSVPAAQRRIRKKLTDWLAQSLHLNGQWSGISLGYDLDFDGSQSGMPCVIASGGFH